MKSYYSMKHQKKKDLLLLATKLIEKMFDVSNAKEYNQSYLKKKNKIQNPDIVDIKSNIIEHSKNFT